MYYQILETLAPADMQTCLAGDAPFTAVLSFEEWGRECVSLGMELEPGAIPVRPRCTKAEVNYDSVTGAFSIPDRNKLSDDQMEFSFVLNERCVIFIDDGDTAQGYLNAIRASKKWRSPCMERFLRDFLEAIVSDDVAVLERYETALGELEGEILDGRRDGVVAEINSIRRELRTLQLHYEQLADLTEEFCENENNFFDDERLSQFHMFSNRITRLLGMLSSNQDLTLQLRELHQSQLDLYQNHVTTMLTVVTTIFLPLTLIAGWYGMNFRYMPELESPLAYPIVIAVSVAIVCVCIWFFKHKKWL